ncbi:protein of unknown function [Legionella fallonii LLAP-10]|uniref:Uncharacterized protein n=1 Tax=Legionella fallonii LLAP-10 TaxID=1212491 RepID=A0A098G8U0_9GAMM|nr:protein of unknown function [Legionella fallonii LLAP-10]
MFRDAVTDSCNGEEVLHPAAEAWDVEIKKDVVYYRKRLSLPHLNSYQLFTTFNRLFFPVNYLYQYLFRIETRE